MLGVSPYCIQWHCDVCEETYIMKNVKSVYYKLMYRPPSPLIDPGSEISEGLLSPLGGVPFIKGLSLGRSDEEPGRDPYGSIRGGSIKGGYGIFVPENCSSVSKAGAGRGLSCEGYHGKDPIFMRCFGMVFTCRSRVTFFLGFVKQVFSMPVGFLRGDGYQCIRSVVSFGIYTSATLGNPGEGAGFF